MLNRIKILAFVFVLVIIKTHGQNAPVAVIGDTSGIGSTLAVPITVTGFSNISICELEIHYDPDIALATAVYEGPGVFHTFFIADYTLPGTILISWFYYAGLSLPDSSEFMILEFERVSYGYTDIQFDNSTPSSCEWGDSNGDPLNDIPYSNYYFDGSVHFEMIDGPVLSLPEVDTCQGPVMVDFPVTVHSFNQIGSFTLTVEYNEQVLGFQSFSNNSGFPQLTIDGNSPGILIAEAVSSDTNGVSLPDNSVLFTLHFEIIGGSTDLIWYDDGMSCHFTGPAPGYEPRNDEPQAAFYGNGSFTEFPLPGNAGTITGPAGGLVCPEQSGVTFSVSPISNADGYVWQLPPGATITNGTGTPVITVSFGQNAESGEITVYGINLCGNGGISPPFQVTVGEPPEIISQPVTSDTLVAGADTAVFTVEAVGTGLSFQWQVLENDWVDISDGGYYSGSNTDQLMVINPPITLDSSFYRCKVSGECGPEVYTNGQAMLIITLTTGVGPVSQDHVSTNPLDFKCIPNPFSGNAVLSFRAPSAGMAVIEVFSVYGRKLLEFRHPVNQSGINRIYTDFKNLASGLYFARITFRNNHNVLTGKCKIVSGN